jgi:hypothetical protein
MLYHETRLVNRIVDTDNKLVYIEAMVIQELLNQLREKGWSDAQIGRELGVSRIAVWRWRVQGGVPIIELSVEESLRRLLRRVGPPGRPRQKGGASHDLASPVSSST